MTLISLWGICRKRHFFWRDTTFHFFSLIEVEDEDRHERFIRPASFLTVKGWTFRCNGLLPESRSSTVTNAGSLLRGE